MMHTRTEGATKNRDHPGWSWDETYCYSQALRVDNLVFVSGQAAIAPDGAIVGRGDFLAQSHQAFANLAAVLQAAGCGLEDVVKVTIFLTDMRNFPAVIELRKTYFRPPYPADTIVQVQALALPDLLIEIEAIACIPPSTSRP